MYSGFYNAKSVFGVLQRQKCIRGSTTPEVYLGFYNAKSVSEVLQRQKFEKREVKEGALLVSLEKTPRS